MPYSSASASKNVTVLAYKLSLSVDKTLAKPRETVTFTATLMMDGSPVSGATIEFYIVAPEPPDYKIGSATTGADGKATLSWTVPYYVDFAVGRRQLGCQTWGFYAYYPAGVVYSNDVDVKIANPTRLTISTDKNQYKTGDVVTVTVKLEYEFPADRWNPLANQAVTISAFGSTKSVTTGSDGTASTTFVAPSASGTYTITASYGGYGLTVASASATEVAVKAVASFSASPIAPAVAGALLMALSLLKTR
jgi:hypothetical protein